MVFSSTIFLFGFLPIVLLGYYLFDKRFKNVFLLIASLFFYAWGEPKFVLVMLISIGVNYFAALFIDSSINKHNGIKTKARIILVITIILNIAIFFVFKYLNFTMENIRTLLSVLGFDASGVIQTNVALPIGISFFTFQAMSYIFDVYSGKGVVQKNPLHVALYISLFPQLIAGPIVRYQTISDEITLRKESLKDFSEGVQRFIIGLSKKVLIANTLAVSVDAAYGACSDHKLTVLYAWFGAIAYTLQIYFDFSGYSDMAIGLGRMFGFHFLENFNYPYLSKNISEFWRRWHISLGSWFRDYIYFPLGGSRVNSKAKLLKNLLVVWLLTGIWHGANWTFILWGLLYFCLISFEKISGLNIKIKNNLLPTVCYQIFTLLCIICGWVLFRADSLSLAGSYLSAMFGFAPEGVYNGISISMLCQYVLILVVGILACFDWKTFLFKNVHIKKIADNHPNIVSIVGIILLFILGLVSISFVISNTYNPFIYFNF